MSGTSNLSTVDIEPEAVRVGRQGAPSTSNNNSNNSLKRLSHRSLRSTSSLGSITDREGKAIVEVGREGESVPLDLLQSLYINNQFNRTHSTSPPFSEEEESSPPASTTNRPSASPRPASPARNSLGVPSSSSHNNNNASGGGTTGRDSPVAFWPIKSVTFTTTQSYPPVKRLPVKQRKRVLVTGGAGFVGSHLVDRLMFCGHDVVVLDNFFSGSKTSISHWVGHPNFELVRADVVEPFMVEVDQIYHLACPASPKAYQANAVKTLKTNFMGSFNMLGLAKRVNARFLLSKIYGSPKEHPQNEEYWGNVNPVGPRSCYDEGKRVAEALTYGYHRQSGVEVRVVRIFNCYGPRMNADDGRVVSNFIVAALRGEPLEVYGDGTQTRSLMYIEDLVTGLMALMGSNCSDPVNIGSEDESTIVDWAQVIIEAVREMRERGDIPKHGPDGEEYKESEIVYKPAVVDDPPQRRPDITRAKKVLGWQPTWTAKAGIEETIRYFSALEEGGD